MDDSKKQNNEDSSVIKKVESKKKQYISPEMTSEDLMAFGALCNGTIIGGRKSAAGAPNFCNAGRLLS